MHRQQLTLFINKPDATAIEAIREKYNPRQYELIDSHVTLCREDEIPDLDRILENLARLDQKALTIHFNPVTRFDHGNGVLLPARETTLVATGSVKRS